MKKYTLITVIIVTLILGVALLSKSKQSVIPDDYVVDPSDFYSVDTTTETALQTLSNKEETWLIHMREEEKLARDVYTTLGETWGTRIFSNIASSEQTHTDSVKTLLDRYSITDPVTDDTVGVFTLPEIQELYNNLVAQGNKSVLDALTVGATIEDLDIKDLDDAMSQTSRLDITTAYENLQKGSRNHMRAFSRLIEAQGSTYEPAYITPEHYQDIVTSAQERGRL